MDSYISPSGIVVWSASDVVAVICTIISTMIA